MPNRTSYARSSLCSSPSPKLTRDDYRGLHLRPLLGISTGRPSPYPCICPLRRTEPHPTNPGTPASNPNSTHPQPTNIVGEDNARRPAQPEQSKPKSRSPITHNNIPSQERSRLYPTQAPRERLIRFAAVNITPSPIPAPAGRANHPNRTPLSTLPVNRNAASPSTANVTSNSSSSYVHVNTSEDASRSSFADISNKANPPTTTARTRSLRRTRGDRLAPAPVTIQRSDEELARLFERQARIRIEEEEREREKRKREQEVDDLRKSVEHAVRMQKERVMRARRDANNNPNDTLKPAFAFALDKEERKEILRRIREERIRGRGSGPKLWLDTEGFDVDDFVRRVGRKYMKRRDRPSIPQWPSSSPFSSPGRPNALTQDTPPSSPSDVARLSPLELRLVRYDRLWSNLRPSSEGILRFSQVPWPILYDTLSPAHITRQAITAFLFHPLRPGLEGKSRRCIVREELLRWHPDKFRVRVLDKVVAKDRRDVVKGAEEVVRVLTKLMNEM